MRKTEPYDGVSIAWAKCCFFTSTDYNSLFFPDAFFRWTKAASVSIRSGYAIHCETTQTMIINWNFQPKPFCGRATTKRYFLLAMDQNRQKRPTHETEDEDLAMLMWLRARLPPPFNHAAELRYDKITSIPRAIKGGVLNRRQCQNRITMLFSIRHEHRHSHKRHYRASNFSTPQGDLIFVQRLELATG